MATPRIFVSSTCYDLQEVRAQLRGFIEAFGYIPVMSEYGDIFYDYEKHIQDACKDEIAKCQLFVLIIGNSYGSLYYDGRQSGNVPDSITLQEVKRALESNIYKHIFINKFVDYDYKNYKRALENYIAKYFEKNDISRSEIDSKLIELKKTFDKIYIFPQSSYSYIFNFIDLIYDLKSNNAVITYETFDDIKESLKKQWAGFVYDSLIKNKTVSVDVVNSLHDKIDRVENQIKILAEGQISVNSKKSEVTFDIKKLTDRVNFDDFEKLKENLNKFLIDILYKVIPGANPRKRIMLSQHLTVELFLKWLQNLDKKLNIYKWSKEIKTTNLFHGIGVDYKYNKYVEDIPYSSVASFYNILLHIQENFSIDDYNSLLSYVVLKFNELYEEEKKEEPVNDLPF